MSVSNFFFTVLSYLSGYAFPAIAGCCGLVALYSLVYFVRDIFSDIRRGRSAS